MGGARHKAAAAAAATDGGVAPARAKKGGCGSVRWREIFYHQSWGGIVVLLAACVVTGVAHFIATPSFRPIVLYDASVSMPLAPKDTVSIEAAAIIPFAALVVTVLLVEFAALRGKQSLTMAIHATFHIIFWAIIGFAVVLAITEATKPFASRYRPDFMSRCRPVAKKGQVLALGESVQCAGSKDKMFDDGRKSFPSGHSSNSMSLCWFAVLYFVHALYWRDGWGYLGSLWSRSSCGMRLLMEVLQGLFIVWGLAIVAIAWCVGVSRYSDNRHNIDDILGGFVVSLLWMTPVLFIALGQLNYHQQQLRRSEEKEAADAATLPVVAPGSAAAAAASGTAVCGERGTHAAAPAAATMEPSALERLHSGKDAGPAAAAGSGVNGV